MTERNELLICDAMRTIGFDSAEEVHGYILESLYVDEVNEVLDFLKWLHKSGLPFGRANSQLRWIAFKESNKPPKEEIEKRIREILYEHEYHWGYKDNIVEEFLELINQNKKDEKR